MTEKMMTHYYGDGCDAEHGSPEARKREEAKQIIAADQTVTDADRAAVQRMDEAEE